MNYEKMKKADLIDHIKTLKKEACILADDMNKFRENVKYLSGEVYRNEKEIESISQENASLAKKIETLKKENASLADTASKRLETLKKHIARSQKAQNEREDVIAGLFSLYSTVLLEDRWNDRIEWKNQILEEIQYLIRYIG